MCLETRGKGLLGGTGEQEETMVSSKTVPEDLNLKLILKFNPGFTNHGCLQCAILKSLYGFKEKRDHKARDSQFLFQNVQNEIFEILKIIKNYMKFRAAC